MPRPTLNPSFSRESQKQIALVAGTMHTRAVRLKTKLLQPFSLPPDFKNHLLHHTPPASSSGRIALSSAGHLRQTARVTRLDPDWQMTWAFLLAIALHGLLMKGIAALRMRAARQALRPFIFTPLASPTSRAAGRSRRFTNSCWRRCCCWRRSG